jgi:hypothetical protein
MSVSAPAIFNCTNNCTKCHRKFVVDKVSHLANRQFTKDVIEHGGNMSLNLKTGQLVNSTMVKSRKYNQIEMDRGAIDFHSHPGKCKNDNMCALGLPSPQDIFNVIVGSLHGTRAHMVYAKEGTYLIRIDERLLQRLVSSPAARDDFQSRLYWTLEELHKHFVKNPKISYALYRRKWMLAARQLGINVKLFSKNRVPSFELEYDCAAESMGTILPSVEVSAAEEKTPKKQTRQLRSEIKRRIQQLFRTRRPPSKRSARKNRQKK